MMDWPDPQTAALAPEDIAAELAETLAALAAEDARAILIHNEGTRLVATYMNNAAVAILAVSVFTPVAAFLYSLDATLTPWPIGICFLASFDLHWAAKMYLGRLK